RWGDTQVAVARTKHDDWLPQIDNVVDNFFPYRNPIVLDQLRQAGLFNDIIPPRFLHNGREITGESTVEPGTSVRAGNTNGSGIVYLTTDGSDPRLMDGSVSPSALAAADTDSVVIQSTTRIKARVLDAGNWSPLHEITLPVRDNLAGLKITEIHYSPLDEGEIDGRELEFIELKNTGNTLLNLTGARFVRGIDYTFPAVTLLDTGAFLVLASNSSRFNYRYGFYPFGEYTGQLDNGGEWLALVNAAGDTLIQFRYNDRNPWPEQPSDGYSLVPTELNPAGDPADPANWRASYFIHGSAGREDDGTVAVSKKSRVPERLILSRNYPNPFNPETAISYTLPERAQVEMMVINSSGQRIRTLVDEHQEAGSHRVIWDSRDDSGRKVPSGLFICRLRAGSATKSMKMMMMK
ncbi:lamin tail domain-containing protein, partial [bacterium]|nr:lamin tail domain-containing protein [bacterium]